MTAYAVVKNILGDLVSTDLDSGVPYIVGRTWAYHNQAIFVDFDDPRTGSIGLRNLNGTQPDDLAEAAHEAYHALLHWQGTDSHDEQQINNLTERWLHAHLRGPELVAALLHLQTSRDSYR